MDYMDEFLNTFDNEFDDDDFDDFENERDFYAFDFPFHPDIAQRDPDWRDRDRRDRDRDRDGRRRRVRCCVYRHRRSRRIRKICQSRDTRCANRLGRDWILIDSYSVRNCNRCI